MTPYRDRREAGDYTPTKPIPQTGETTTHTTPQPNKLAALQQYWRDTTTAAEAAESDETKTSKK